MPGGEEGVAALRRTAWLPWVFKVPAAVALVAVLLLATAVPAGAHASLQSTEPADGVTLQAGPDEVVLVFDEAISAELGSGIRVLGPDGNRVDRGPLGLSDAGRRVTAPVDSGGRGTYTVAWKVVSEDSHVLSGSFVYHVQVQTGAADIASADGSRVLDVATWVARWLVLAGATLLGGAAVLRVMVRDHGALASTRAQRWVFVPAVALVVGSTLRLLLQVADVSGRSVPDAIGLLGNAVAETRAGRLDGVRVLAAVLAFVGALLWRRKRATTLVLVAATAVMVVNTVGGHAITTDRSDLAVLADLVHQYAVAVWVGGLVAVAVLGRVVVNEGHNLLGTFSRLAGGGLVVVAATGAASAWLQVQRVAGLWSTGYGRVLTAKVAIFAIMAALGWWNRSQLRSLGERLSTFMVSLRAEAILGGAALGVTAALVGLVPAREQLSQPFAATVLDGAGQVTATVDPARPGANTMHLYFYDEAGRPRTVDTAEARVESGDIPPRKIDLVPVLPNHYSALGFSLPRPGQWRVTVTSLSRGAPATAVFEVPVR